MTDWVETLVKRNSFITLKEHKANFASNPECRLNTPTDYEFDQARKYILKGINDDVRRLTNFPLLRSTNEVTSWIIANRDESKTRYIIEFHPCISIELLLKAFAYVKRFTDIRDSEVRVLRHPSKTVFWSSNQIPGDSLMYVGEHITTRTSVILSDRGS